MLPALVTRRSLPLRCGLHVKPPSPVPNSAQEVFSSSSEGPWLIGAGPSRMGIGRAALAGAFDALRRCCWVGLFLVVARVVILFSCLDK